jgi:hypothetical protein
MLNLKLTEKELHTLTAAVVGWSDQLAEIVSDQLLRMTDREMVEDAEHLAHDAEVLCQKMTALSHAIQADRSADPVVRARHVALMDEAVLAYLELTV